MIGIYYGQLDVGFPFFTNSWDVEIDQGPQPILAQISLSCVSPSGNAQSAFNGEAVAYIDSYTYFENANYPNQWINLNADPQDLVSTLANPTMTGVNFVVFGGNGYWLTANVLATVMSNYNLGVYPPYGIPPP